MSDLLARAARAASLSTRETGGLIRELAAELQRLRAELAEARRPKSLYGRIEAAADGPWDGGGGGQVSENGNRLIDNLEVCRRLGVKPDTWRKRVERGDSPLPFSRQGARTYYREKDVAYYLKKGVWPPSMAFKGRGRPVAAGDVEAGHA